MASALDFLHPMTKKARESKPRHAAASDTAEAVDALVASLVHPAKRELEALRAAIVAADASIREGVKWNAPSFRTTEYFATTNLRAKTGIGLILHFGAKVRDVGAVRDAIADPRGLLTWLAADRAMIAFESMSDLTAKTEALQGIVRQWIRHVDPAAVEAIRP